MVKKAFFSFQIDSNNSSWPTGELQAGGWSWFSAASCAESYCEGVRGRVLSGPTCGSGRKIKCRYQQQKKVSSCSWE